MPLPSSVYCVDVAGESRPFESAGHMVEFLRDNINLKSAIDISYKRWSFATISCDLNNGKVKFNNSKPISDYITNTIWFTDVDRKDIITSIENLISLVAKLRLLGKLDQLIDPKTDQQLSQIIKDFLRLDLANFSKKDDSLETSINNMLTKVDETFNKILSFSASKKTSTQAAVCESLNAVGLANIKSNNEANKIIDSINKLTVLQKVKYGS